ncbi:MAG TPA: hypothetical protein VGI40_10180 [Pirellulaceae bacterium]|jgi:hypothetical protein
MKMFELTERSDQDRILHLAIPVEKASASYRVVVHVQPILDDEEGEYLSDDFINETAGKWVGELTRPPQGEYEQREPL